MPARARSSRWSAALLGLPRKPESDHAADALAVAICHAAHLPATPPKAVAAAGVASVIASVRGEVLLRRPDHVVIESAGVGYRLAVSAETLKAVPAPAAR